MPVVMIAFFVFLQGEPARIEVEFNSMEACRGASQALVETLAAAGLCVDRFTGTTAVWGPSEPGATGPDAEPAPEESAPNPPPNTY